jgi:1-phosphatidylinositol-4-phosphate 5-kinase
MSNIRKIYFVVMGNVFPPHKDIHETYDLKGSTFGRFITADELAREHLATLKDLNWMERGRKLKLGPEKATMLMNQLKADCLFLAKVKIMDYSLLVGIHYLSRGNKDNIRERSMMMLEPTTPMLGKSTPAFKQSSISAAAAGDSTGLPQERKMCIYYSEDGGFMSSHRDGTPSEELYFLGIIDILTPYSVSKRIEHVFKSIQYDKRTISAINPLDYSQRFLKFMADNILQDTESDYATKQLPQIPNYYSTMIDRDAIVIEEDHGNGNGNGNNNDNGDNDGNDDGDGDEKCGNKIKCELKE